MTALVLGAGGQLGSDLVRVLPGAVGLTHADLSVTDLPAVEAAIARHRPEVVYNCAAYNAVDRAETESELAHRVNSEGAFNVALACGRNRAKLVHFSTNFVFDGSLERPYVESDVARPLGAYARSKLDGEGRALAALPSALVVRTAALYGDRGSAIKGGSFPGRIVDRARRGDPIRVVRDQLVNPTYTLDLAESVVKLAAGGTSGLIHLVAAGCCAWDEFARAALAACGFDAEVEGITSDQLESPAQRPANGCLASVRVPALRPWQEGLQQWAAAQAGPRRKARSQ